jgi:hypothetical protein
MAGHYSNLVSRTFRSPHRFDDVQLDHKHDGGYNDSSQSRFRYVHEIRCEELQSYDDDYSCGYEKDNVTFLYSTNVVAVRWRFANNVTIALLRRPATIYVFHLCKRHRTVSSRRWRCSRHLAKEPPIWAWIRQKTKSNCKRPRRASPAWRQRSSRRLHIINRTIGIFFFLTTR